MSRKAGPARWQATVGFTLIKLLVVISIVALLIAMLLPALKTSEGDRSAGRVHEQSASAQHSAAGLR